MKDILIKAVAGVSVLALLLFIVAITFFKETVDYYEALSDNTVGEYVTFRDKYPGSKYWNELNEKKSYLEEPYFLQKKEKNTIRAYDEFLFAFPADRFTNLAMHLRDSLQTIEDDIAKYGKNFLPNGSFPYVSSYGENIKAKTSSNSDIVVTAPIAFDMIAVIKKDNEEGKVAAHAYIQADSSYTFKVNNGTYQMFFYIGKGWHPEKSMQNNIKGGFVSYETYSKDSPVTLFNEVISYRLSMREKKKSFAESSREEVFR